MDLVTWLIHVFIFGEFFQVLQIRRDNMDNLGIISHISPQNIFCDLSFEPSHQDGSNEGSQHMFFFEK